MENMRMYEEQLDTTEVILEDESAEQEEDLNVALPEPMSSVDEIRHRTGQLFELIAFDPKNELIYRNEIIEINIRLVTHVLKKYKPFTDDEFQSGCLGLITAARTFQVDRGVPFASYACFCIERELHKVHRDRSMRIEYILGAQMESLDAVSTLDNGDSVNKHERIVDDSSEEAFEHILMENSLADFFEKVIDPTLDKLASNHNGASTQSDFDTWRQLEKKYLLEMAEVQSQKARITFSAMSRELGVSVQNVRVKHQRVIDGIKARAIELGYEV